MVVRGHVRNGVIVFEDGLRLPEGEEVTVLTARSTGDTSAHSLLDIPAISLGTVLRPLQSDDDMLGEMLEGRA